MKEKILIIGLSPVLAGTETFIMTYYRNLDPDKFQIDFIVRTQEKVIFEDEIRARGSQIFYIPPKRKNPIVYKKAMHSFFSKHASEYHIIWYHVMGVSNIDMLIYAKKYGIEKRIIHSHVSQWRGSWMRYILHQLNKKKLFHYATDYFACSQLAAQYLYNGSVLDKSIIINNAVDIDKFLFSVDQRKRIREELGWSNNKVIGNIGRLAVQKNQPFLLDVFNVALKQDSSLRLVILGDNSLSEGTLSVIKQKIQDYHIHDKVKLVGSQSNIQAWLSAFDLFILPSLFEGLPLSAVEAQANGLPVLVSDTVTEELKILDSTAYLPLDADLQVWAQQIITMLTMKRSQQETIDKRFAEKGFDIKKQVKDVENILLGEQIE
ncbi:glycosyltransferase family 1 protein [Streptococcus chenjunshii]|uniref:Glycosyltransferase family 1 protein n=1 Tax=Streptococcus chenjunshii TaxID=2173853 RepID=A0A372KPL4_9STRE|nr:glycosyltransferase [Streptococcus chenjunshii]AXQ78537.1 glycosyltransferase family 1 protein [Streptococcus chenjunshii]RFU52001.1 glycosyltransferase family 1 protein [Streptococcus chenjunshii]RFU54193.1 glycosyltransferase family 1 protein [Streptococcus chenjunshii]